MRVADLVRDVAPVVGMAEVERRTCFTDFSKKIVSVTCLHAGRRPR